MAAVKILAADNVSLTGAKKLPADKFEIISVAGISNEEIIKSYNDSDVILIRSTRKLDGEFISSCRFKIIATFTKGTDHIDMEATRAKGIEVINAEEGNHISAAEHTMALILSLYKNLQEATKRISENRFEDTDYARSELFGKTIGIIGFGKVGSRVAHYSVAFGMNILANDTDEIVVNSNPSFKFAGLETLLSSSDIVSLHIPFNEANEKFVGCRHFECMKKGAVFINTSRGGVVDEECLIKALQSLQISGAGLDVFANEPDIDKRYLDLKNVVLSNHTAGKTSESRERISALMFEKILSRFP